MWIAGALLVLGRVAAALRAQQVPVVNTASPLYLAYGERATAPENKCRKMRTPMMCTAKPGMGNFSAHLVISSYKEDFAWLNEMPWSDNVTVFVHDSSKRPSHWWSKQHYEDTMIAEESELSVKLLNKVRSKPVIFEHIASVGDEASAFLTWIIKKYYKLPEVAFFVHAHRCADHAQFDMALALPSIRQCFKPEWGYLDLNSYHKVDIDSYSEGADTGNTNCMWTKNLLAHPTGVENFRGVWTDFFMEEYGPLPNRVCSDAHSQFAVTRDRIRKHPVSFYKQLFGAVANGQTTMEFFWRALFVPGAVSWEPLPKKKEYVFTEEELRENARYATRP
mmetsp:Transcript_35419/g.97994  ORF Transcript_35419/g.97994 Transcript_35419/m.97994 type:complete len:335 (-) Transcript_35419:60-1064(-)